MADDSARMECSDCGIEYGPVFHVCLARTCTKCCRDFGHVLKPTGNKLDSVDVEGYPIVIEERLCDDCKKEG